MSTNSDKIKRYERLAIKNTKYYVSIGDLYSDDGDFKTATFYYQKAVDNGVVAYTVLGDTWGYRSQYKKEFRSFAELKKSIDEYVDWYNNSRIVQRLGSAPVSLLCYSPI